MLTVHRTEECRQSPFRHALIKAVEAVIPDTRPQFVIAPDIETAFGMMFRDTYLWRVGAATVPPMCGEPEVCLTFLIGLFGLDKLNKFYGPTATKPGP